MTCSRFCGCEFTRNSTIKPNIIFILVDDMGWTDLGCFGSDYYETPNIDRLRNHAMKFTNAYAASAVCSPTRASIMTGRYPTRTGITDWIHHNDPRAKNAILKSMNPTGFDSDPKRKLLAPVNKFWLEHDEITIPELLKAQGYISCHVGKWHLGPEQWYPDKQGFDYNIGGCEFGQPPGYFDPYTSERFIKGIPTLAPRQEGEYLTDRETDEAVNFIKTHNNQPFFLYMSHYAVHSPIQAKEKKIAKYENKKKANHKNPVYAAMVESVDEGVGKIMKVLEENDLVENTMIIFTSDNGGAVHFDATDNAPLRKGKGYPYEGGIRVPLLISWPGVIKPGSTSHEPVSSIDFLPTICRAADARMPANRHIDGLDLKPLFKQTGLWKREALYWHFPHYWWDGRIKPYSIIRKGHWKLIRFYEDERFELYNLSDDISEENDLADLIPDKVHELNTKLTIWLKETGAKLPVKNPNYNLILKPEHKNRF